MQGSRVAGHAAAFALACVALAAGGAGQAKGGEDMGPVEISNGTVVVGVVPSLGGRVVVLRTVIGDNVLDSDPKLWKPPHPLPSLETPFQPWNGRIVWAGPQNGFWSQQDLRPDLRDAKAPWPPDPFNETGRFEVVARTPTLLKLKGATSPVTGLSLEHAYEITGERTVRMRTTATNGRTTPVSWDIWPNTRVRPEGHPYVDLDPLETVRMDGPRPDDPQAGAYPSEVHGGWLTLPPGRRPGVGHQKLWAKAFVRPAHGLVAFFLRRQILLIRAPLVPKEKLHADQAFVEIYRGADPEESILELEMHGPYETLAPGASTSFEQTFELLDDDGPPTEEGRRARLALLR